MTSSEPLTKQAVQVTPAPEIIREFELFFDEVSRFDGASAFSEQTVVELRKAQNKPNSVVVYFWYNNQRQLVGAYIAVLPSHEEPGIIEGAVLPEFRHQGIASALLSALEAKLHENFSAKNFNVWAHQVRNDDEMIIKQAVEHLTEKYGFNPVRDLRKMHLPLTEQARERIISAASAVALPHGVSLRTLVPGQDDAAWLELNAAAFADHPEQGSLDQSDLQERYRSSWFRPEGFFLAESADGLAGYHWTKISADQCHEGEVYAVGIAPQWQGRGLGKALTLAGMRYLAEISVNSQRLEQIALYVDAENTAAVSLYESLGFTAETIDIMYAAQ